TGRLPFTGRAPQVLTDKQSRDAPAPRDLLAEVPEELNTLTVELLRRDPAARLTGCDALARMGLNRGEARPGPRRPAGPSVPFVGREEHLGTLGAAAREVVTRCRLVALFVHGRSGVGKTALVQKFLDGLTAGGDVLVLAGRCYEQESVP